MSKILISIIIPCYNSSKTIVRALDSVKNQTSKCPIEIIVINDGSTDNSLSLIEDYKRNNPEINLQIIDKSNGGVSSARNAGLKNSSGNYIALLDSDDEWLPDKLEKQMNFLRQNPNVYFIGGSLYRRKVKLGFKEIKKPERIKIKDILITMNPQTSTALFRRSVIDKIGFYNENLSHGEDGDMWYRIFSKFESWVIPDELVIFDNGKRGFGGAGLSGNLNKMQKGVRRLTKIAYKDKKINKLEYYALSFYNEIKFIRRLILSFPNVNR